MTTAEPTTAEPTTPSPKPGQSWRSLDLGQRIGVALFLMVLILGGRWGCSYLSGSNGAQAAARSIVYELQTEAIRMREYSDRYTYNSEQPLVRIDFRNVSVSHEPISDGWLVTGRMVYVKRDGTEVPAEKLTTFDLEPAGGGRFRFRGVKEGDKIDPGNQGLYPRDPDPNPYVR